MGGIQWRYLGEDAIEISDISFNIHFQLGLRDYLKSFPKLGIASFMFTDKTLTLVSEKYGFMSVSHIIDRVAAYQHKVNENVKLPLRIIPICYDEGFALDQRRLEDMCKLDYEEIIADIILNNAGAIGILIDLIIIEIDIIIIIANDNTLG